MKTSYYQRAGIFLIILIGISCKDAETKEDAKILQEIPFVSYTDSIAKDPENYSLYLNRAALLAKQGFHQLAGTDYSKAWELSPTEANALELGANLENQNQPKSALDFWYTRKKQFPSNREFPRRISKLLTQMGDGKAALQELKDLIKTDSSDFITWFELGQLQAEQGDSSNAQKSLERSYLIEPGTNTALLLASIYSNKRDPRVLLLCDQILQSNDPDANAFLLKGIYFSDKGQYSEARKEFDACIKADYTLLDAHIEKGISFFREKNYLKALQSFEMALQVSKTNPDTYYWMGRCFETLQKPESAKEYYERALSLDPEFTEAKEHLNSIH
jgi:tetratricopeptide (TPR) repeat protein